MLMQKRPTSAFYIKPTMTFQTYKENNISGKPSGTLQKPNFAQRRRRPGLAEELQAIHPGKASGPLLFFKWRGHFGLKVEGCFLPFQF